MLKKLLSVLCIFALMIVYALPIASATSMDASMQLYPETMNVAESLDDAEWTTLGKITLPTESRKEYSTVIGATLIRSSVDSDQVQFYIKWSGNISFTRFAFNKVTFTSSSATNPVTYETLSNIEYPCTGTNVGMAYVTNVEIPSNVSAVRVTTKESRIYAIIPAEYVGWHPADDLTGYITIQ